MVHDKWLHMLIPISTLVIVLIVYKGRRNRAIVTVPVYKICS
jgi:hypothetical protein